MKNLVMLSLLTVVFVLLSCEKQEVMEPIVLNETIDELVDSFDYSSYSDKAILAFEGRLCTENGYGCTVSVIVDTLYPRYHSVNDIIVSTVWHTEFFYYNKYGSTMWCNEEYLAECK